MRSWPFITYGVWLCASAFAPTSHAQLPDGDGKAVVERACGVCHTAEIVKGRQLKRDEWSKQVARMQQEGAELTAAEFAQVVDYLARNFGPSPKIDAGSRP